MEDVLRKVYLRCSRNREGTGFIAEGRFTGIGKVTGVSMADDGCRALQVEKEPCRCRRMCFGSPPRNPEWLRPRGQQGGEKGQGAGTPY